MGGGGGSNHWVVQAIHEASRSAGTSTARARWRPAPSTSQRPAACPGRRPLHSPGPHPAAHATPQAGALAPGPRSFARCRGRARPPAPPAAPPCHAPGCPSTVLCDGCGGTVPTCAASCSTRTSSPSGSPRWLMCTRRISSRPCRGRVSTLEHTTVSNVHVRGCQKSKKDLLPARSCGGKS